MSAQPLESRVSRLEGAYEQVGDRLNGIDARLERMEAKLDQRFAELDAKFDRKFDAFSWRMTALILTTWISLMLTVLFRH